MPISRREPARQRHVVLDQRSRAPGTWRAKAATSAPPPEGRKWPWGRLSPRGLGPIITRAPDPPFGCRVSITHIMGRWRGLGGAAAPRSSRPARAARRGSPGRSRTPAGGPRPPVPRSRCPRPRPRAPAMAMLDDGARRWPTTAIPGELRRRRSGRSSGRRPGSRLQVARATSSRSRSRRWPAHARAGAARVEPDGGRRRRRCSTLSVISSTSRGRRARRSASDLRARSSDRLRLGDLAGREVHAHRSRVAGRGASRQAAACRQASREHPRADAARSARSPRRRDELAGQSPRSGCCQRTSASTPRWRPCPGDTIGW